MFLIQWKRDFEYLQKLRFDIDRAWWTPHITQAKQFSSKEEAISYISLPSGEQLWRGSVEIIFMHPGNMR